jgi:hypothetical protein
MGYHSEEEVGKNFTPVYWTKPAARSKDSLSPFPWSCFLEMHNVWDVMGYDFPLQAPRIIPSCRSLHHYPVGRFPEHDSVDHSPQYKQRTNWSNR